MTGIVIALVLWLAGSTWIAIGPGRFLDQDEPRP